MPIPEVTSLDDLISEFKRENPLEWLKAGLWTKREQTRRHKKKLARKTKFTRTEKMKCWNKHFHKEHKFVVYRKTLKGSYCV